MSRALSAIEPLVLEQVEATMDDKATLRLRGVITMRVPSEQLGPYFRAVHDAAVSDRVPELRIDTGDLSFVNSSSIRLFIDWVEWINAEPERHRYVLHFLTNPEVTWQRTTFSAIQSLGRETVRVTATTRKPTGS